MWLMVWMVLAWSTGWAQTALPVPALSARVIDQTGTLSAGEQQALEDKLAAFESRKGSQLVVLMVPTTQPEDIASYANRVANTWKIGRKDVGDGLLVVVAKNDRKMRIEVAKTLEGAVPDIAAARIIDQAMKPRFRENDFAGGLEAATDQLIARINGEALPEEAPHSAGIGKVNGVVVGLLFVGALVASVLAALVFGFRRAWIVTAMLIGLPVMLLIGWIVLSALPMLLMVFIFFWLVKAGAHGRSGGGGWSSGSSSSWSRSDSSSSSDSFSSGGGGDFGGGGASGDW